MTSRPNRGSSNGLGPIDAVLSSRGGDLNWTNPGWPDRSGAWSHAIAAMGLVEGPDEPDPLVMPTLAQAVRALCSGFEGVALEFGLRWDPSIGLSFMCATRAQSGSADVAVELAIAALDEIRSALPREYVWGDAFEALSTPAGLGPVGLWEIRKTELTERPSVEATAADFLYTPIPIRGDGSGWPQAIARLRVARHPVFVSCLVMPAPLHALERHGIRKVTTALREVSEPRFESSLGSLVEIPADEAASASLRSWSRYDEGIDSTALARVTVVGVPPEGGAVARSIAAAVSSRADGVSTPLAAVQQATEEHLGEALFALGNRTVEPWGGHPIWDHPHAPVSLRRLPFLSGATDAAAMLCPPCRTG